MRCQVAAGIMTLLAVFGCSHTDEHRVANPTTGADSSATAKPPAAPAPENTDTAAVHSYVSLPDRANFIAAEPPVERTLHQRDYDY